MLPTTETTTVAEEERSANISVDFDHLIQL